MSSKNDGNVMMMVEGVDPDAPQPEMSAVDAATAKLAMQTSLPRNPSNKRVYGDAKRVESSKL